MKLSKKGLEKTKSFQKNKILTFGLIAIISIAFISGCVKKEAKITNFDECVDAGYAIVPPTPGGYTECRTPDGKVFYFEEISVSLCAKDGELLREPDEYCCEGLKEWPIPDTRFSIADICYEVGQPSEILMRMCIKCGDGICGKHLMYDESPCNCPEDCKGKNKSMFQSIEEFCQSNDWKISLSKACEEQETIKGSPICKLC